MDLPQRATIFQLQHGRDYLDIQKQRLVCDNLFSLVCDEHNRPFVICGNWRGSNVREAIG
jgi:hypothetical protein